MTQHRSFGFGFDCRELYCLKVVELIFLFLIVNYVVDLIMCVILVLYNSCIVCLCWSLPVWGGSQNRQ
jgi:hypothetical protein